MPEQEFHFVKCAKCGAKLCKETDSYRFIPNDGRPLCYECFVKQCKKVDSKNV